MTRGSLARTLLLTLALGLTATAARADETIELVTTGKGSALEWPLFIGQAKGFFKSRGIAFDMSSALSTATAMQQVTAGSGDMGVGGLTDPIRAIDQGAGLSLLTVETAFPPYSLWGKPGIASIAALKGKTVIVGGAKDVTLTYFERMAVPSGLKKGDYDLVYAGTTASRYAALRSGAVDAAILYPPASFAAAAAGYAKLGDLADFVKDMPFTGYAVNVRWAKAHRGTVEGFLAGLQEGVAWFYDRSHRSEAIDIMVAASGAQRSDVEQTYDDYARTQIYPDKAAMSPAAIVAVVDMLAATDELKGAADPKRFIDPAVNAMLP